MAISGANEVYKKVSPLIESQFPEYIRENGPNFVAFLEAYYEYLEQTNKAGNAIRTLNDNQDIDRTVSDFVEYFRREFALSIPKSALADKRLIVKHIREFYRSRGSQKSFKFLFHVLFGKEVNFYYPGEDILRASDGRWIQETVLTVETNTGNLFLLDGRVITGQTSGAIGRVQGILKTINLGAEVFKLTVEKTTGTFEDKEIVSDGFGNTVKVRAGIGGLTSQKILNGGVFNVKGDFVSLVGGTSSSVATGTVSSVEDSTGVTFKITKGGTGYRTGVNSIFAFGPGGTTLPILSVASLSNTSTITIFTDLIKSVQNVKLDGGIVSGNASITFAALGANSTILSANLASANIYSVIGAKLRRGTIVVGSINAISVLSTGSGYTTGPTVTVIDQDVANEQIIGHNGLIRGRDAQISSPGNAPGAITGITIRTGGTDFILGEQVNIINEREKTIIVETTDSSTSPGIARYAINNLVNGNTSVSTVSGFLTLPGRYLGTKGFLSWNNKIQDNDYYQEFSYVLKSEKLVDSYRDVVQNVLHAAGTKMFGLFEINSQPDMAITVASSVPEIIYESNFIPVSLEDGSGLVQIEDPGIRFIQENVDYDGFISHEGYDDEGNLISEEHDINFVSYVEQETPGAYIRDSRKEIITATADLPSAVQTAVAAITESGVTPADLQSAFVTKEVNVAESVTPADLPSAVQTAVAAITESGVAPADTVSGVQTAAGVITESGVTPADTVSAVQTAVAAITESGVAPADLPSAVQTAVAAITESGVAPADLPSAVKTTAGDITESGVTPADTVSGVQTAVAAITESGVAPADTVSGVQTAAGVITESGVAPADLPSAVQTAVAAITESGVTPADLSSALTFKLATTTGQSTGFVRVVYGNTQITTFSKDTVNLFKGVQLQTMSDLDGIPRLVLVTPPNVGTNMDRQANGNFGNGTIISSTTVKIIPVGGSNTNLFTVSTVYSNNFLTLSTDYLPTTANAELYWGA